MKENCCSPKNQGPSALNTRSLRDVENDMVGTVSFSVEGMHCGSCAARIESALRLEPGVNRAVVDFPTRVMTAGIDPQQTNIEKLKAAVVAAGYRVSSGDALDQQREAGKPVGELEAQRFRMPVWLVGIFAAAGLVAFYLGLLTLVSDWDSALMQLEDSRWWVLALSVGLGIQVALYTLLRRNLQKQAIKGAGTSLAASGGMSSGSMAACCAHFVVPILPVLGLPVLSAAAATLAEYQNWLFLAGVLSNLVGITVMLRILHRNGLISKRSPIDVFPVRPRASV
jgi:copper chaperone CopZ